MPGLVSWEHTEDTVGVRGPADRRVCDRAGHLVGQRRGRREKSPAVVLTSHLSALSKSRKGAGEDPRCQPAEEQGCVLRRASGGAGREGVHSHRFPCNMRLLSSSVMVGSAGGPRAESSTQH